MKCFFDVSLNPHYVPFRSVTSANKFSSFDKTSRPWIINKFRFFFLSRKDLTFRSCIHNIGLFRSLWWFFFFKFFVLNFTTLYRFLEKVIIRTSRDSLTCCNFQLDYSESSGKLKFTNQPQLVVIQFFFHLFFLFYWKVLRETTAAHRTRTFEKSAHSAVTVMPHRVLATKKSGSEPVSGRTIVIVIRGRAIVRTLAKNSAVYTRYSKEWRIGAARILVIATRRRMRKSVVTHYHRDGRTNSLAGDNKRELERAREAHFHNLMTLARASATTTQRRPEAALFRLARRRRRRQITRYRRRSRCSHRNSPSLQVPSW